MLDKEAPKGKDDKKRKREEEDEEAEDKSKKKPNREEEEKKVARLQERMRSLANLMRAGGDLGVNWDMTDIYNSNNNFVSSFHF